MAVGEAPPNLLRTLMAQVDDLDLDIFPVEDGSKVADLLVPGLEMSKIFAIIEFAFRSHGFDTGILEGIDMMSRDQAKKAIASSYLFEIKPASSSKLERYFVDMRKSGKIIRLKEGEKPAARPDLVLRIGDRDMVGLALGAQTPQRAFLTGKLKAKGNIIVGLRLSAVLNKELNKLTAQSKL